MDQHTLQPHKQITVLLPKGRAMKVVDQLFHEHGITRADVHHARGVGKITPQRHRGIEDTTEKEIMTVIVEADRADEIFEYIFFEAEINRPHGGLMFQQPVLDTTMYSLPEEVMEEQR